MTPQEPQEIEIREAAPEDAALLKPFGEALLGETPFFHRQQHERARSVEEMAAIIGSFQTTPRCALFNAWAGDIPVGEAVLLGGQLSRILHTATVGVGVLQAWQGQGIGRALMERVERTARAAGIRRLELTVMVRNERAIALYRRLGYVEEGRKTGSVRIDGMPEDELLMARHLAPRGERG